MGPSVSLSGPAAVALLLLAACGGGTSPSPVPSCAVPADCGTDTACRLHTCTAGVCGTSDLAAGAALAAQVPGDCLQAICDGHGGVTSAPLDADLPADDGSQCTTERCVAGVPSHPAAPLDTACNQNGGAFCDGAGSCVAPPTVTATSPADLASSPVPTPLAVTFSSAMDPATLTAQVAFGPCTGSIQLATDAFASCAPFASATATLSGGDTVATLAPAPGLLASRTYQLRVTTAAASAAGRHLATAVTTAFATQAVAACQTSAAVVISQVYGGGGNSGAPYTNDFVELHNRGPVAVSLGGWSVQYASSVGTTWTAFPLPAAAIPPGGYFLVQLGSTGVTGAPLPAPDAVSNTISLAFSSGKVALVGNASALAGACPSGFGLVDLVGYGTASCASPAPPPSNTTAILRGGLGCDDTATPAADFAAGAPAPRNAATAPHICPCSARPVNETGLPTEADYCTVQFPLSLSVQSGTPTPAVYGRIYEAGVTEPGGAAPQVTAQLGHGLATANPQYETGWTWVPAAFSTQVGNDEEYQASFTAPAPGSYRYAYRFSLDAGQTWTYCDAALGDGGAGSNAGLNFDLENLPVLTVTP